MTSESDELTKTARGLALDFVKDEVEHLASGAAGVTDMSAGVAFTDLTADQATELAGKTMVAVRSIVIVMLTRWSSERGIEMRALWSELSELLACPFSEDGV